MQRTEGRMTYEPARPVAADEIVEADVTLRPASGRSIIAAGSTVRASNVHELFPPPGAVEEAEGRLRTLGLKVIASTPITVCVTAPAERIRQVFGVNLTEQRIPGRGESVQVLNDGSVALPVPKSLKDLVEAIHLGLPTSPCSAPAALPPDVDYFHVAIPGDLARLVDAVQCHRKGIRGEGVRLAMVDEGTFRHPFYDNYDVTIDESQWSGTGGDTDHGTHFAANALAIAPGVDFLAVRITNRDATAIPGLFYAGTTLTPKPDVIIADFGADPASSLGASFADRIAGISANISAIAARGIVVCSPVGVATSLSGSPELYFPACHPDVISIGGTYADEYDRIQASSYAPSGCVDLGAWPSMVGKGLDRQMPDLTGYVGMADHLGRYITLPCDPGGKDDVKYSGPEAQDGTPPDDGWFLGSSTSSSTPQVAGVACLLIQALKKDGITPSPSQIKSLLEDGCTDVIEGTSATGEPAAVGRDNATGAGVVDAFVSINKVDVWMRGSEHDSGLVPSHEPFWACPDIKVVAPSATNPEQNFESEPRVREIARGADYQVWVKARNRGIVDASNVSVTLEFARASQLPFSNVVWKDGNGGLGGGQIKVDGGVTNTRILGSISARGSAIAEFMWTSPEENDTGEFQWLATVDCTADPLADWDEKTSSVADFNNVGWWNELRFALPPAQSELDLGRFPDVGEAREVHIDTRALPDGCEVLAEVPQNAMTSEALEDFSYEDVGQNRIRITLKAGEFNKLRFEQPEHVSLTFTVTTSGPLPPGEYPVDCSQWDETCIGGVRLVVESTAT